MVWYRLPLWLRCFLSASFDVWGRVCASPRTMRLSPSKKPNQFQKVSHPDRRSSFLMNNSNRRGGYTGGGFTMHPWLGCINVFFFPLCPDLLGVHSFFFLSLSLSKNGACTLGSLILDDMSETSWLTVQSGLIRDALPAPFLCPPRLAPRFSSTCSLLMRTKWISNCSLDYSHRLRPPGSTIVCF